MAQRTAKVMRWPVVVRAIRSWSVGSRFDISWVIFFYSSGFVKSEYLFLALFSCSCEPVNEWLKGRATSKLQNEEERREVD